MIRLAADQTIIAGCGSDSDIDGDEMRGDDSGNL
jgi:hypothetical protein